MIAGTFLVHYMMARAVHHLHLTLIQALAIGFVAVLTTVAGIDVKDISKVNTQIALHLFTMLIGNW